MRETIAKLFCVLTVLVVVGLSCLFAWHHNSSPPSPPVPAAATVAGPRAETQAATPAFDPALEARARAIFERSGCATCHSVAGMGNPRVPLDQIGAESTPDEIRQWTTGTGDATAQLSESLRRRKQRYLELPESDLDILILWLAAQR